MRIFLDANILFSAAKSDGAIRFLLELLLEEGHELCADAYVLEEARRNLAVKSVHGVDTLAQLLRRIHVFAATRDAALEGGFPLPEKDRPVLAAAVRSGCDLLMTGDKTHFGAHYGRTLHGVTIHSPQSLAKALGVVAKSGPRAHEPAARYGAKASSRRRDGRRRT